MDMGALLGNGGGNITVGKSSNYAQETSVMTSVPPVQCNSPAGHGAMVWGTINFTPGAGTTSVQIRIRRGSGLSGPALGPVRTVDVTAGNPAEIPFGHYDSAIGVEGGGAQPETMQYTVTLEQAGSPTATGLVNYMSLMLHPSL